ncbi:MAG TPA: hypothetical protein VM619_06595 [Luteimonas sp.]|nr:hypothetical protein [Luteimonas sp.]
MTLELWLAYGGYLAWLVAGLCDFLVHRRTDLPHTSGVAESTMHLLQLALLGIAVVVGMGFEVERTVALLLLALVILHAAVGYRDSRIAFGRARVVLPVEQHLHSVLDMAPPIALAWLLATTWPAAMAPGWAILPRTPALPAAAWVAALLPPAVLCVLPALLEFRAAWRAARA